MSARAFVEDASNPAFFADTSRHIKVMVSTDKTITDQVHPRFLRGMDDLKAFIQRVPFFPHKPGSTRVPPRGVAGRPYNSTTTCGSTTSAQASQSTPALIEVLGGASTSVDAIRPDPDEDCPLPMAANRERHAAGCDAVDPSAFLWIDVKKPTRPERNEILSLFPLHAITLEKLAALGETDDDDDRLEFFPAQGYTFLSLTGTPPNRSEEYPATIVFMLFDNVLLTISDGGYLGEENVALSAVEAVHENNEAGISTIFSAIVSSLILQTQGSVAGLMIDVDQLDELVLQIQPSEMDQNDMLTRIRGMRHRVARVHTSLLLKERVLKQLLLPTLRHTTACRDPGCVERYQRCLTLTRGSIERLRKARDTVNLSCMNLVSGVSARLVQHCHWMDYLNHVQSQISLVVMPVAVIPGLWAANVGVPWENTETTKAFWGIVTVTMSILVLGLIYPIRKYFRYKPPGALVPSLD